MLTTIAAFIVALGLLIAIHEYGHYRVAVACGVRVLRFSVGFGKPIFRWQRKGSPTEFVIGAIPLGGYVKMLDEREAPVPAEERHLAFNTQPLRSRAAIVAAGPLANLLLAVLLYSVVNWWGVSEPRAVLASPVKESIAARAGLKGGETVQAAGYDGSELAPVRSFEELRWLLTQGALDGRDVRLGVGASPESASQVLLRLSEIEVREADATLFRKVGIVGPWTRPVIGEVVPGMPAAAAGLKTGDVVRAIDGTAIVDGGQLFEEIRASRRGDEPLSRTWQVERGGQVVSLAITPKMEKVEGGVVARIGAQVAAPPEMTVVRYGPVEGLVGGAQRTWEVSILTLRMLGRMVIGEASIKNLSGPLTIAEYAGKSASLGFIQFLVFLAMISVSLGVLNLLPIPVLDGGHLMYYLWEGVTGKGVSEAWMERLQRGGVAVLMVMMSIALFNDVSRHVTRLFG
ncbi:MAG: RIP metalloprotease RseP [Burkholderiaceae bacterium]